MVALRTGSENPYNLPIQLPKRNPHTMLTGEESYPLVLFNSHHSEVKHAGTPTRFCSTRLPCRDFISRAGGGHRARSKNQKRSHNYSFESDCFVTGLLLHLQNIAFL